MPKPKLRPFIYFCSCFSAANLVFFKQWADLLGPTSPWSFESAAASHVTPIALMLDICVLAVLLWIPYAFAYRKKSSSLFFVSSLMLLGTFPFIANAMRATLHSADFAPGAIVRAYGAVPVVSVAAIAGLCSAFFIFRFREKLSLMVPKAFLVALPFLFLSFGSGIARVTRDSTADTFQPLKTNVKSHSPARLIWLVFDMWDYRLTFLERPKGLRLPNIDQLKKDLFFAKEVLPPASWTAVSMPSLITGKSVEELSYDEAANTVRLDYCADEGKHPLGEEPNVFQRAWKNGYQTALLGWHLPYCRMFGRYVGECLRYPVHNVLKNRYPRELGKGMLALWDELGFIRQSLPLTHLAHLQEIESRAIELATDPKWDFVFVHWPIPHYPYLYDREKGDFVLQSQRQLSYWDNLVLLDRTIGKLRQAMEASGEWDLSSLLISSDHSAVRTRLDAHGNTIMVGSDQSRVVVPVSSTLDKRIPFFLKLPKQTRGREYSGHFNAIVSSELSQKLLHGDFKDLDGVEKWLAAKGPETAKADRCLAMFQPAGDLP